MMNIAITTTPKDASGRLRSYWDWATPWQQYRSGWPMPKDLGLASFIRRTAEATERLAEVMGNQLETALRDATRSMEGIARTYHKIRRQRVWAVRRKLWARKLRRALSWA